MGTSDVYIELRISVQKKYVGAAIYINAAKEKYSNFINNREYIENALGMPLKWSERTKDCTILASLDADVQTDEAAWTGYFDWLYKMALKLKAIIQQYGVAEK